MRSNDFFSIPSLFLEQVNTIVVEGCAAFLDGTIKSITHFFSTFKIFNKWNLTSKALAQDSV
jgi:hypothetical protein